MADTDHTRLDKRMGRSPIGGYELYDAGKSLIAGGANKPHAEGSRPSDAQRRSAAGIRRRLVDGGYLHLEIEDGSFIAAVGLSAKAYDAVLSAEATKTAA